MRGLSLHSWTYSACQTALILCAFAAPAMAQQPISEDTKARISRYTTPVEPVRPAPVPLAKPEPTVEQVTTPKIVNNPYDNYVTLSYENDLIGGGSDQYYTNGVRLTWYGTKTSVPIGLRQLGEEFPGLGINETTATYFTLGQNMYTPADIEVAGKQPNDRPWAGWLYGSVGLTTLNGNHMDDFEVTLGVVGPDSMAEQTQKFVHTHITDSPTPKGWSNQLDTEPGVILSWQRRWPSMWALDFDYSDLRLAATPNINASVGNVYTYGGTGMTFTFGPYQKSLQDIPPRVRPAMAGTGYFDVPDQNWGWYLFAGVDGRAVAHNIFLDGNSFDDDGPSVDKKILVGDAFAGVAVSIYDYRLAYTYNYRGKEFDGQDEASTFGSLSLTARF